MRPGWVILIIGREIAVTWLRSRLAVKGYYGLVLRGKNKTFFQAMALIPLMIHYPYFGVDLHLVGMVFLWIALALTVWSGLLYFFRFYPMLMGGMGKAANVFSFDKTIRLAYSKGLSGNNSVVECNLAKVEVAGSNPVSRSIFLWRHSQVVRQRSAKPLFSGSNPDAASNELFTNDAPHPIQASGSPPSSAP